MTVAEVRWIELPARGGHAQAGRRPAIVAQSTAGLPTTLVIPLTSQLDALRFPGTVLVEADAGNGLRRASVALIFQLTAVDNRFVMDRMGIVSEEVMKSIWSAFDELTGR
ncbi:MAG: mRNA interferase MazF [Blastocatellia bacterium]|jgi:mRNA-degrading endonuclease toxin of MazEF toxin-antitoxin module|nr:mRNA interferase MazF [Blastocatellia bacterium]